MRDRGFAERADVLRVVVCGRADAPDGRVAMIRRLRHQPRQPHAPHASQPRNSVSEPGPGFTGRITCRYLLPKVMSVSAQPRLADRQPSSLRRGAPGDDQVLANCQGKRSSAAWRKNEKDHRWLRESRVSPCNSLRRPRCVARPWRASVCADDGRTRVLRGSAVIVSITTSRRAPAHLPGERSRPRVRHSPRPPVPAYLHHPCRYGRKGPIPHVCTALHSAHFHPRP